MIRKYLFLDIDGVLNSAKYFEALKYGSLENKDALDPVAVARLNRITDATGAKIVVSSSWRHAFEHTPNMLFYLLKEEGITGEMIGITPTTTWSRWCEIKLWLDNNIIPESFIIIDDMDYMGDLQRHLINTKWAYGLLDEHVERAIKKLNNED